ncbi:retrotransposon protein, putative, ty1-copia subclass [Tanacetum coccineum]
MIKELKSMFEKQAGVERFDLIQTFHAYKQEEGKPVGLYVIKLKGYVEKLECLGYVLPQDINVGLILNGVTVMAIQGGRIQEAIKKSQIAKGKGKGKGKGKDKRYTSKPKNPKPFAKERPTKDDVCHHCKEVGYYKRNYTAYLAELIKKKKQVDTASSSGIFTIELFSFPTKSWVYDTGCGTHICNTKHDLRGVRKLKQVEAIRSDDLVLPNGLVIYLDNYHYAPTITRGVVSVSRLVNNDFTQCFTDYGISVSKNDVLYFNAISSNGIYEIIMINRVPNVNSIYTVSNKRAKHNLDSTYLWKRIENLQHDGLLKSTDDESFDKCASCLSDRGGEYISQKFKDYLKACGIVQQLTSPYTPQHNGVSERRNRTLLDMGCEALVKRETTDKLQQRSIKCIFIGYPKETMDYYFNFPPENKIVVSSEIPMKVGFEPSQEEVIPILRSARTHQALDRLCLNVEVEEHSLGDLNEPTNYKAAILDSESDKWVGAINTEIQSVGNYTLS